MRKQPLIILIILTSLLFSNSRVAFSRPGSLIRSSSYLPYNPNSLFSLSLSTEITSIGEINSHSSSVAINKTNANGTSWGFSYALLPYQGIDPDLSNSNLDYELGVHFQTNLYSVGKTHIVAGVHDFLINDDEQISLKDLSMFLNFSNSFSFNNYSILTSLGAGGGKLAFDPHTQFVSPSSLGLYAAMKLNVPLLSHWGGVDFITEIIHGGLNLALAIPFTKEYKLFLGMTHIENLSEFSSQTSEEPTNLEKDDPAVCFGLEINLPKVRTNTVKKVAQQYPLLFINGRVDSSLFQAGEYIYFLKDSIEILKQDINNISSDNIALTLEGDLYRDSLNNMLLKSNINNTNHNAAMRHLSKSLRLYYQGDFQQALIEVDKAIELQPHTAIAYARKGSIYYKLNQLDRATLNWNIALKLDPEYTEVRDMLNALKDNKLRSLSTN